MSIISSDKSVKKSLILLLLIFPSINISAQIQNSVYLFRQYFDGADTTRTGPSGTIPILMLFDGDSTNVWQIGAPQKAVFDSAFSNPRALMTDTLRAYPPNVTSSCSFGLYAGTGSGIAEINWKQKLDTDYGFDGGKVEVSFDEGDIWENVFYHPFFISFMGYQAHNIDTFSNGDIVFTGTDSVWRTLSLRFFLPNGFSTGNSILLRFTFMSDSLDHVKAGWMIDNLEADVRLANSAELLQYERATKVFPNPTSDKLHVEIEGHQFQGNIEQIVLLNSHGQELSEWRNVPSKFSFSVREFDDGFYYVRVKTKLITETIPILIKHE